MPRPLLAVVLALATLLAPAAAQAAGPEHQLTIRRTAHGIPHVLAADWRSLGYGSAYSEVTDNICPLADTYVTVDAERSRFFGPEARNVVRANSTRPKNIDSDIFYKKAIDQDIAGQLAEKVSQDLRDMARGYAEGYNAALRAMGGRDGVRDDGCRGKPWVREISAESVWRRFYMLAVIASSGVAIEGIAGATPPPGAPASGASAEAAQRDALASTELRERLTRPLGIGSNAIAFGKAFTADGGGLLLGNPHFPWYGTERFYEKHLTIPGEVDVAGGALLGVPIINIGFTRGLAWSHTVSTARRFLPYELRLVPGQPTTYLVDGQPRKMTARKVTVQARQPDGSLRPVTRTLYDTVYGPVFTSILGLPVFPWTPERAYAMYDVNVQARLLEHFFQTNKAQSTAELDRIERTLQGVPWVNTIATDAEGTAYYTDMGAVPNLDRDKQAACQVALGVALDRAARLPVVDGSRSACAPGQAPGAAAPGILPPHRQPTLVRDDHVSNMNDSYWLTNPEQPLEGFPRIQGDERTARSLRTRNGLTMLAARKGWTTEALKEMIFNNRHFLGEMWQADAVAMCRQMAGQVPPAACDALERWDRRDDLASRGAILFRRFAERAVAVQGGPYRVPFDAQDPVGTPRGLNTENAQVRQALVDAVRELGAAGLALDVPLGEVQTEPRGGPRIPIHGGPDRVGVFNTINPVWRAAGGYERIPHGSSYVQVVAPKGERACPDAHAILTYSQASDPQSPWYSDQTELYSRKGWVRWAFCEADVHKGTIERREVGGGFLGLTARRGGGRTVLVRARRAGTARVVVRRAGKRVSARTVRVRPGRTVRVRPVLSRRGASRVTVTMTGREGDVSSRRLRMPRRR